MSEPVDISQADHCRAGAFTALLVIVNLVMDGWNGRPGGLAHQLLILPFTGLFLWGLYVFLKPSVNGYVRLWTPLRALQLALAFEFVFIGIYFYEIRHFAAFGYRARPFAATILIGGALILLGLALRRRASAGFVFVSVGIAYVAALLLSILSFPLNYLRSDMLPVIFWANRSLLLHIDPYATVHVGSRLYDFPYLPGMMLAYYPVAAMGIDIRLGAMLYLAGIAGLIFWAARSDRRLEVASLLALFLLCPFLQYRHELYLAPHWFTLVLLIVLMQRRHFAWAAVVFGLSIAIYQFSWILFPFFLLNALRRRGWLEVGKLIVLGAIGVLALAGPLLRTAGYRILHNTVGQWGHLMKHAIAEPMNLSYWVTYLIAPNKLLRLQAALMIAIFFYCFFRGRCADLVDTLRWMIFALATFVMFNVLVDGYFYLMLLVLMLLYTCIANGWMVEARPDARSCSSVPN